MSIKEKINKVKIVSFDIFGTLLVRNVLSPYDVFDIVQSKYNDGNDKKINDFRSTRILCEKQTKSNCEKEEITFDDIYITMNNYYDKITCKKLKKIEVDVELNICVPNPKLKEIYNYCLINNKKIFITSDMYLPKQVIEQLLSKNDYKNYNKLFLSSDTMKKKTTGSIYSYFIDTLKINNKDIIHIGDNIVCDYIVPKRYGIKSYIIRNKKYNNSSINQLNNFINNTCYDGNVYYRFGYSMLGPLLYSFCQYVHLNSDSKKIYFLSRDGFLMKKAYDIIYKNNNSNYLYASRRALIVPTFSNDKNINSVLKKISISNTICLKNLLTKLGLSLEDYKKELMDFKLTDNQIINKKDLFKKNNIRTFLIKIFPKIISNSKKEAVIYKKYLKQFKITNNSTVVDIGWNGNMQLALERLTDMKFKGCYMGVYPTSPHINEINMNGFLFDSKNNIEMFYYISSMLYLFEDFFLAPHGSVKTMSYDNNEFKPILYDYEFPDGTNESTVGEIQKGALEFVNGFSKTYLNRTLIIDVNMITMMLKRLASHPSYDETVILGNLKYSDIDINYIAKPLPLSNYIFHPSYFMRDFRKTGWFVGFLKRMTKCNLGYYKLYKFAFKKRNKIK